MLCPINTAYPTLIFCWVHRHPYTTSRPSYFCHRLKKYHIHCFPKIPDTFQKYIFPLFTILPHLLPTLIFDHNMVIYSNHYHAHLHCRVITQMFLRLVNIQHMTKIPSNESDITIGVGKTLKPLLFTP